MIQIYHVKKGMHSMKKILCIGHEYSASKFKSEMCTDHIYGKRISTKCTGNRSIGTIELENRR